MWQVPQGEPYVGDVANAYNDGPPAPGKKGVASRNDSIDTARPRPSWLPASRWCIVIARSTCRPTRPP